MAHRHVRGPYSLHWVDMQPRSTAHVVLVVYINLRPDSFRVARSWAAAQLRWASEQAAKECCVWDLSLDYWALQGLSDQHAVLGKFSWWHRYRDFGHGPRISNPCRVPSRAQRLQPSGKLESSMSLKHVEPNDTFGTYLVQKVGPLPHANLDPPCSPLLRSCAACCCSRATRGKFRKFRNRRRAAHDQPSQDQMNHKMGTIYHLLL